MPAFPDEGARFRPKWFVIGFAFAAVALIVNYDLRLGLAAGALFGVFAAVWLYLAVRFGFVGNDRPSYRRRMLERFRQQLRNRRAAAGHGDEGSGA